MQSLIQLWIQVHFGKNSHALVALITHLILKSNRGPNVLEILLIAVKSWRSLGVHARMLLGKLLSKMQAS